MTVCSNCGFPTATGHWSEAGANPGTDRVRARFRRIEVLRRVLPAYSLSVHGDAMVPELTISTLTGNQQMVSDLGEFWCAAEKMGGRPIDPLDPAFLAGDMDDDER